jgi:glutamate 5-kinase
MASKIQAAKTVGTLGLHTYIACGTYPDTLVRILAGEAVGTHIHPAEPARLSSRKRWIGYALKPQGELVVDDGAKQALTIQGKSLLPSGIREIVGQFHFGDAVYCVDPTSQRFAQGLVNYSAAELRAIMGQHTSHIEKILGYKEYDEVIHRDNLVLL